MGRYYDNAGIYSLPVSEIDPDIKGRIGMFHPAKAEALSILIAADGQNDPIKVVATKGARKATTPWTLVAGLHRLHACELACIEVKAIEVFGDNDELIDMQASENLHRRALGPIERACFVRAIADVAEAKIKAAHGGKSQQEVAISARWDKVTIAAPARVGKEEEIRGATMASRIGWQESVAATLDMGVRSIKRDLMIYRYVVAPDRANALMLERRDNPLPASEILKLVKVPADHIRAIIIYLINHPGVSTVDEAMQHFGMKTGAPPAVLQSKYQNNFFANWERFDLSSKGQVLPQLVEKLTPGLRRELRALLDGEDA